jgi:predicted nucleic acid-binding protein
VRAAYFDSSAIIKLGHPAAESQALIDYLSEDRLSAATSVLSDVEVRRALVRLASRGSDVGEHVRGFFLIDLNRDIRDRAVQLPGLRSLEAIHVATALSIGEDLDFISYDDRLAAAARAEGLRVVQPGRGRDD